MFIPVGITVGAGGGRRASYDRIVETSGKFDRLGEQVRDLTVPFTRIGEDLHAQISAAFATEGASGASGRWHELSPAYRTWKARHAPGAPILVGLRPARHRTRSSPRKPAQTYSVSGRMMMQLLRPLADRTTWRITPQRLLYLPQSNIAGYHETGTPRMPARPPVDPSLAFLHSIDRTFAVWLDELMVHAGFAGPGSG